ncbi:MAG: hypothetical protein M3137_03800 [Actinomycetota bacterium]|nr:hypothetical protein [Actinomycetota bacterium]
MASTHTSLDPEAAGREQRIEAARRIEAASDELSAALAAPDELDARRQAQARPLVERRTPQPRRDRHSPRGRHDDPQPPGAVRGSYRASGRSGCSTAEARQPKPADVKGQPEDEQDPEQRGGVGAALLEGEGAEPEEAEDHPHEEPGTGEARDDDEEQELADAHAEYAPG